MILEFLNHPDALQIVLTAGSAFFLFITQSAKILDGLEKIIKHINNVNKRISGKKPKKKGLRAEKMVIWGEG